MNMKEVLNILMDQAGSEGITREGSMELELTEVNPADTLVATIVFHVDKHHDGPQRRPHLDLIRVEAYEPDDVGNPIDGPLPMPGTEPSGRPELN